MRIAFDYTVPNWAVITFLILGMLWATVAFASALLTFIELWQRRKEFRPGHTNGPDSNKETL